MEVNGNNFKKGIMLGICVGIAWGLDGVLMGRVGLNRIFSDSAYALSLGISQFSFDFSPLVTAFFHEGFCFVWVALILIFKKQFKHVFYLLFKTKKGGKQVRFVLFSLICLGGLGSCMDKNVEVNLPSYVASDPNVEVVFTDYSPLEGAVRTNMFINGSNFGTDPSLIRVVVGGKEAKVVSSSGTQIYCIVPSRADGGFVQVDILNKDKSLNATYTFEQKFSYQYNVVVGTLCGVVDSEGNTSITDGNFDKAGTQTPLAMYYDESSGERCIYFFENEHSLRKIYLDKDSIATVITNGAAGWSSAPSGLGWSVGRDTMFVNCPQGNVERAGAYYLLRKENFKNSYPALNGDDFNTLFTHPIDGTIFLCRGRDATLHKAVWNEKTQMWDPKQIAKMGRSGWFQCVTFHPS